SIARPLKRTIPSSVRSGMFACNNLRAREPIWIIMLRPTSNSSVDNVLFGLSVLHSEFTKKGRLTMPLLANTPPATGASRQTRDTVATCKPSPAVQSYLEALQAIGNDLDELTHDSVFWSWTTREALAANVLTHIPVRRVEDIWVPAR